MSIFYPDNTASRTVLSVSGITDSSLLFNVLSSGERSLSLSELKKTGLLVVNVLQYGADPTGAQECSSNIQAAADFARDNGLFLTGAPGTYLVDTPITLKCNGDLSQMTIQSSGSSLSTTIIVGNTSGTGADALLRLNLRLPKVVNSEKVGAGWSGFDTSVGIDIANLYESILEIPYVVGFGIGVWIGGYTAGSVYNTLHLQTLSSNKVNLKVGAKSVNGWANQNTFIGGRFVHSSSEGVSVSGINHIMLAGYSGSAIAPPNNNLFLNPSVEGDEPEFHLNINGSFNTFINPRLEVPSGAGRIRFYSEVAGDTNSNQLIGGYKNATYTYVFDGSGSYYNGQSNSRNSDSMEFTGCGVSIVNRTSSGETGPHIQGFPSSVQAISKTAASTDWTYRLYADGMSLKASGNTYARVKLAGAGTLSLGPGTIAPTAYLTGVDGAFRMTGAFEPVTDSTYTLGASARAWSAVYADEYYTGSSSSPKWSSGSGSPDGVVTAVIGSLYSRIDGGTGTALYFKESGAGNTGWIAK